MGGEDPRIGCITASSSLSSASISVSATSFQARSGRCTLPSWLGIGTVAPSCVISQTTWLLSCCFQARCEGTRTKGTNSDLGSKALVPCRGLVTSSNELASCKTKYLRYLSSLWQTRSYIHHIRYFPPWLSGGKVGSPPCICLDL